MNLTAHTLTRGGDEQQLSFYEVELLRLLHERAGQPVSRDEILQKIWGLEASADEPHRRQLHREAARKKSRSTRTSRSTSSRSTATATSWCLE